MWMYVQIEGFLCSFIFMGLGLFCVSYVILQVIFACSWIWAL